MAEIMDAVNTYVLARLIAAQPEGITVPANITEDFFPGDSQEELMCRHDPSPLVTRRYLTGAYWATFNFSYYTRSIDPIAARRLLEAVLAILNIDSFSDLFGVAEGRVQVITQPSPVGEDDAGVKTFAFACRLTYFQEATS